MRLANGGKQQAATDSTSNMNQVTAETWYVSSADLMVSKLVRGNYLKMAYLQFRNYFELPRCMINFCHTLSWNINCRFDCASRLPVRSLGVELKLDDHDRADTELMKEWSCQSNIARQYSGMTTQQHSASIGKKLCCHPFWDAYQCISQFATRVLIGFWSNMVQCHRTFLGV